MKPGKRKPPLGEGMERARELRRTSTFPERLLWKLLRGGRLGYLKFRRQHPVGPYVADFYCHEAKLVVEIDGATHDLRAEEDRRRTEYLQAHGLSVLRVSNEDVLRNLEGVAIAVLRAAGRDDGTWH